MGTQLRRLVDCGTMIGSDDIGPGFPRDFAVTSTAASGVQNSQATQFTQRDTCLRLKRRAVLVIMSDLVLVPLQSETRQMLLLDEPRNPVDQWISDLIRRVS